MDTKYPLHFTLDDDTKVTVEKTAAHLYDFALTDKENGTRHFTYNDDEVFDDKKEAALDFDSLNALRKFWLMTRDEE